MRLLLYIALVICIVFISNEVYTRFGLYADDIKKCNAELIYDLDSSLKTKNILYFGESSNFTVSEHDSSKKSISELITDCDANYRIGTITKGAIHAGTYQKLIRRIEEKSSIQAIVLTINLRSFGINWIESDLETNLSRANIVYLTHPPIVKKLLLSFKAYDNNEVFKRKERIRAHYKKDKFMLQNKRFETVREWDAAVFNTGVQDQNGRKDQQKTDLACHFIKNFAFNLTTENPRIKDLDHIVAFCNAKNIKLVFNLLPENYEKIRELCGVDLEILMRTNVAFLKKRYENNTLFIDNFYLVKDSCFIDRDWPTEHYVYYGRKLVAEKVNEVLKNLPIK